MISPYKSSFDPQPDLSEIELLRSKILSTANRLNSVLNENGLRDQSVQPVRGRGRYRRDMSVDAVLRQLDDQFPSMPTTPCSIAEEVEPEFSSDLPSVADCLADKLAEIKTFSRTTSQERARMGMQDPPLEAADAAMQHCIGVLDVFARRERHRAEVLNGIFESVAKLVYAVDTSTPRSSPKSSSRRSEHLRVDSAHGAVAQNDQPFDARHREQMESAAMLYDEDRKQWVGDLLRCIEQLKSVKSANLAEEEDESEAESSEEEDDDEESDCDSSDEH